MLVVGLTGNIGSGKSSVARILREMGAITIDTDQVARAVVEQGSPGLQEIKAAFGPGVLNQDGTLNRPQMAEIVFSDPRARERLNSIVHPRIRAQINQAITDYKKSGRAPLLVIEAPLLIETGMYRMMDEVWLVTVDPGVQIARIMNRDQSTEAQARQRLAAQMPQEDKLPYAHRVIDNSGAPEETYRQLRQIWSDYIATAQTQTQA